MPGERQLSAEVAAYCWEKGIPNELELNPAHSILVFRGPPTSRVAIRVGGTEVLAKPAEGRVTFVPAETPWQVDAAFGKISADVVSLTDAGISAACANAAGPWRPALDEWAPRIADTARWMTRRRDPDGHDGGVLVERLLARLAASAFGNLARRADDAWLPAATLGRVHSAISAVGIAGASLADLARDAGLGISAYSRGFRGSTGWTPGDYLVTLRMQRVAELLATTEMPMKEIARHVGLSSAAHASQQFRRRHDVTAVRFRTASRLRQLP